MLPELSVDAVHARLIASSVAAVIRTSVGTVGAVRSGCLGRGAETAGTALASTASTTHALPATRTFIGTPSSAGTSQSQVLRARPARRIATGSDRARKSRPAAERPAW